MMNQELKANTVSHLFMFIHLEDLSIFINDDGRSAQYFYIHRLRRKFGKS